MKQAAIVKQKDGSVKAKSALFNINNDDIEYALC